MQQESTNTAILFFTRSAAAEAHHKCFSRRGCNRRDIQIADSLIGHVENQISASGLPYFKIDEKQQVGDSFGERITNAFRSIFDKGFRNVIAVGSDIPLLKTHHLRHAAQELSSGRANIVLGPDEDGGTWLMGYSRRAFEAERFRQLPWNTSALLETILEKSDCTNKIILLETLSDIDDSRALRALIRTVRFDRSFLRLIQRIGSILSGTNAGHQIACPSYTPHLIFRNNLMRAPPTG